MSIDKRKILIVTDAFYPELSPRSFRATELAKEFARQGHKLKVIAKFQEFDYSGFLAVHNFNLQLLSPTRFPRIKIARSGILNIMTRALSRIMGVLFEYPGIETMFKVKNILRYEKDYDLLISIAGPHANHWGVSKVRKENHKIADIWVADCGDPFMFANLDTFRKPFYFKYFEMHFCRKCDYISVPFDEMRWQFYPVFVSKIKVITQGFNFDEISLFNGEIKNIRPVFIFAGSIIPGKRDLNLFVDFLSTLSMDFLFKVFTNQEHLYISHKSKLRDRIEVNAYIDRLSLLAEMSKADFLVNIDTILDKSSNVEAIPSKLIDYALSGRPILNVNSGQVDEKIVSAFLNKDYSCQRIVDISVYNIKNVTRKFLELLS